MALTSHYLSTSASGALGLQACSTSYLADCLFNSFWPSAFTFEVYLYQPMLQDKVPRFFTKQWSSFPHLTSDLSTCCFSLKAPDPSSTSSKKVPWKVGQSLGCLCNKIQLEVRQSWIGTVGCNTPYGHEMTQADAIWTALLKDTTVNPDCSTTPTGFGS